MKMSDLPKLDTSKEYDICGQKVRLDSIEIDGDTAKLMEGADKLPLTETLVLMKSVLKKMLLVSYPDATNEELAPYFKVNALFALMEAFYDVNGMTDKKNLSNAEKIKNAIASRQQLRQTQK